MTANELQSLKNRYDIVGNDPALSRALEIAVSVAPTDLTVLVCGESGVGKEKIPQIIHQNSRRKTGKYFAVNCGAIPEGTIDSELFGHEKGSFTGAVDMRKGYFEEANGGTLFLDEIGELPLSSQAKLLRVLQDGEFIRVGSSKVLKTDVRVIAATNVDLVYAVQKGKFRADLYYRLNAISIKVPALRERKEDISLLFRKFAADFSEKYGVCKINLLPDAVALLQSYSWPGNIRQLKNVAESVSALESYALSSSAPRCEINASVLERYMPPKTDTLPMCASSREEGISGSEKEAMVRMILQLRQDVDYLRNKVEAGAATSPALSMTAGTTKEEAEWQGEEFSQPSGADVRNIESNVVPSREAAPQNASLSIKNAELDMMRQALRRNGNNRKAAAAELGISERTLYRRLKELEEAK